MRILSNFPNTSQQLTATCKGSNYPDFFRTPRAAKKIKTPRKSQKCRVPRRSASNNFFHCFEDFASCTIRFCLGYLLFKTHFEIYHLCQLKTTHKQLRRTIKINIKECSTVTPDCLINKGLSSASMHVRRKIACIRHSSGECRRSFIAIYTYRFVTTVLVVPLVTVLISNSTILLHSTPFYSRTHNTHQI